MIRTASDPLCENTLCVMAVSSSKNCNRHVLINGHCVSNNIQNEASLVFEKDTADIYQIQHLPLLSESDVQILQRSRHIAG